MTLVRRLAEQVIENHPGRAALVLEKLGEEETLRILTRGGVDGLGAIVQRLSPQFAAAILAKLEPARTAAILGTIAVETAVRLIRRTEEPQRSRIRAALEPDLAKTVDAMLHFPEGTAGALMDPDVLALPQELTAREALQRVRGAAEYARYNIYVVDQGQRLVGALNLRELLIAKGRRPLSDLMVRDPHRVPASADHASVLAHPGWKEVHALPVVDEGGVYLGAIRYRVLRELEEEALAPRRKDMETSVAFGQVIAAAAGGLLDALASRSRDEGGENRGA